MFTGSMNAENTDQSAMDNLIIEPTLCSFFSKFLLLLLYFSFDPLIVALLYALSSIFALDPFHPIRSTTSKFSRIYCFNKTLEILY